ncbi:MAG: hypothetical protein WDA16_10335 [Candidatus Thermoplasmatota archaeon]
MLDVDAQRMVFERVRMAAKQHGLLVAPIGSVYFLQMGEPRLLTKDVDTVLHENDHEIPPLEKVVALANDLGGEVVVAEQRSIVIVTIRDLAEDPVIIELLRGRDRPGFLNRSLLTRAADLAKRDDNVLHYPVEFVITLKAEASIDRSERARKARGRAAKESDPAKRQEDLDMAERSDARSTDFSRDVFGQMAAAMQGGLKEDLFADALTHVKETWRADVANLVDAASQGSLHLRSNKKLFPKG